MKLPKQYQWLNDEPAPRLLREMLALYGITETPGAKSNPLILKWAKEIGLGHVYKSDATAWCGLTVAYAAAQAGWDHAPRANALWARNWASWGNAAPAAMLADVLVFARGSAGHVGLYVGEDSSHFHVLGGNQSDQVNIRRKDKRLLIAARRCPWRVNQPDNVRRVMLSASGIISTSEA